MIDYVWVLDEHGEFMTPAERHTESGNLFLPGVEEPVDESHFTVIEEIEQPSIQYVDLDVERAMEAKDDGD